MSIYGGTVHPFLSPGLVVQRGRQAVAGWAALQRALTTIEPPAVRYTGPPVRIHLVDTTVPGDDGDLEVLYNPRELSRSLRVQYRAHTVDGLGFKPLQYVTTTNQEIRLSLAFQAIGSSADRERIRWHMRWLESLCYPRDAGNGRSAEPPPVLLVWPGYVSILCVVVEWEEVSDRFAAPTLEPMGAIVDLTLRELRRAPLTSNVVRAGMGGR